MKPNVVIILEGGLIQNVITDLPVNVTVIDHDTEGADEQDVSRVDGIHSDVYLSYWPKPEVDVEFVAQFKEST